MSKSINDLTTGSIAKTLLQFSIPFFLTSLIQSLYNIADLMVVSHFCGAAGIAGVSIGGSVTHPVTFAIIGLCNGGAIMTAQYAGMKNEKDIKETVGTTFGLMLILAAISTALTLIFAQQILRLLNTPDEAFAQTRTYFTICMAGSGHTLFTMLPSIFSSVIARVAVAILCAQVFDMGLFGVGLSTPTGAVSAIIICTIYYLSNKWCKKTF